MKKPEPGSATTPFGLMYRLERERRLFNRAEAGRLPRNRTGVYALWLPAEFGSRYECIYVGMSDACVRRRLLEHLQYETNPQLARPLRLFRDIVMFSAACTQGHQETLDLETAVIQAWRPGANRNKLGDLTGP